MYLCFGFFFFSVFVVVVVCFVLFLDSGLSVELFTTIKVMHTFFFKTVMCSIFLSKAK